ncbi:glycosyl transferase family group 2-domain-containing protein [Bisporella sp. PMI_857]|nr:glycosyl transferase family group 2-domain-containing protein [Bisporella sp. PMI_857]
MSIPSSTSKTSCHDGGIARPPPVLIRQSSRYKVPNDLVDGDMNLDDEYTRSITMAQFLYCRIQEQGWLKPDPVAANTITLGITLQTSNESGTNFIAEPESMSPKLRAMAIHLNLSAITTMSSDITSLLFSRIAAVDTEVTLPPNNITVPVVDTLEAMANTEAGLRRRDFCCFVREPRMVLVWSDSAKDILRQCATVEKMFMSAIWGEAISDSISTPSLGRSYSTNALYREKGEKAKETLAVVDKIDLGAEDETRDEELGELLPRQFLLTHSFLIGFAVCLLVVIACGVIRSSVVEVRALSSSSYIRLALLAYLPISMVYTTFFTIVLVGIVFQFFGPMSTVVGGNSRYYSSRAPDIRRHPNIEFPHITIQMPVYKEGLKGVIIPTINSLISAIQHYENLGGSASLYVCDDGIQAVKPEVAEMRRQFYQVNNIGWCARPAHGQDGFFRAGRFKKASNLNYALDFSIRVEDELLRLLAEKSEQEGRPQESFSVEEEQQIYTQALNSTIESDGGKTLAAGNVGIGEIILLVDCGTRVPENCLSLGAMELEESPEVAIIQHGSGVMQVIHSVFENGITYFTNLIYLLVKFSVGSGDVALFVGHNAFLRWKAVQSVAFIEDDKVKFWSERHVSEDFDMSLRLQTEGFLVRLSTYDKGGFKEGVSLTALAELLLWEKYAYGCSEMVRSYSNPSQPPLITKEVLNPIHKWVYCGPLTGLFYRLLTSDIKLTSKFSIIGYIGTYFALGAALPLTTTNYFITGWLADELDPTYRESFDMLYGTLFVFLVLSPIAFAWYRHLIGDKMFVHALVEAFTWVPFFIIFFAGISWHICYALLAHLFSLPIEWSFTAKEVDAGSFLLSVRSVLKFFKWVLLSLLLLTGAMIYLALYAPPGYTITAWTSIVPLAILVVGHGLLLVFCVVF